MVVMMEQEKERWLLQVHTWMDDDGLAREEKRREESCGGGGDAFSTCLVPFVVVGVVVSHLSHFSQPAHHWCGAL